MLTQIRHCINLCDASSKSLLLKLSHFCHLQIFFSKLAFPNNYFRKTIKVTNSLDPDQAWHYVRPDMGPNFFQSLPADDTSR